MLDSILYPSVKTYVQSIFLEWVTAPFCYAMQVLPYLTIEFGFFINKAGRRTLSQWMIKWLGSPVRFSFHHPFIIAYDPIFLEVRSVQTGNLEQVIPVNNLRILNEDLVSPECVTDADSQIIFRPVCNQSTAH